jgi:hypothetical protein
MKCIHCRKVLGKYGAYYLRGNGQPVCQRHWKWLTGRIPYVDLLEREKTGEVGR